MDVTGGRQIPKSLVHCVDELSSRQASDGAKESIEAEVGSVLADKVED
jgi:hypothetical protein